MKNEEEKIIGKFYKSYLERELRDPEIVRAKKHLIETYFQKEPFVFPFGWAVPAAAFLALCLLIYPLYRSVLQFGSQIQTGPSLSSPVEPQASVRGMAEVAAVAVTKPAAVSMPVPDVAKPLPPVMIKSVGSETGQVMIYKQSHQENPITVIWVFPGGK